MLHTHFICSPVFQLAGLTLLKRSSDKLAEFIANSAIFRLYI